MNWARGAGIAGIAGIAGAALGAVATGVAVERLTGHRSVRRQARMTLDAAGPYGTLRGTPGTAVAEDGTELYYEIDEPDVPDVPDGPDGQPGGGARGVTVVFSHGYCLSQDVWHFQRAALREAGVRAVYWDQRGHGRSGWGPAPGGGSAPVSIGLLGRDLRAVLDAAVPKGPVVLVGHSMGGMTMMTFAGQFPGYVARRVRGAAFLATSAGGLGEVTYGLPAPAVRAARRALPAVLRALGSRPALAERGRRAASDLYAGLIRRYAFGQPRQVDPGVARFAERLIESVPIDVVARFYPAFAAHDAFADLAVFDGLSAGLPLLVLAGDRDEITPPAHSERIAARLPRAESVTLPGAGHLVLLERPGEVSARLAALLARSIPSHEPAV